MHSVTVHFHGFQHKQEKGEPRPAAPDVSAVIGSQLVGLVTPEHVMVVIVDRLSKTSERNIKKFFQKKLKYHFFSETFH